ncbi:MULTISPECIES: DUF5947 family protein [Streptomyces]|uniref:Uncharacterized protein n=1 Tax=Streptomyces griseoaurantiacus M045 TaxID=996637 RepID=F3NGX2_9ACTN|nr:MULTISPECIES: DUF5947 family protein [Streptomyces]EGG47462.1 hypothetical protein SGM_2386 [Streptomyces griseoaurantiacus M045]GHE72972.1 hypothetical protein GCM10018782_53320 [Streptomyces griseoaurantiacus]
MTAGALARVIRDAADRRAADAERCDLCGVPLPAEHQHLYDTERQRLHCGCRPCALLFAEGGTAEGRYRLVPERRLRLPPVDTGALGVPVGLAFFVRRPDDTVTAHYPSPAGATRWEPEAEAWRAVVDRHPELAGLRPDVEALLVNTAWGMSHHWITPIDDCFRVVALVRREWRGLSGGSRVRPAIEEFFASLTERP